jgi:hypothetical protein
MKTTIKPILITFLLFSSTLIFADDANPADPGGDPGIAPINDCILPMLILGIVLGFLLTSKALNKKRAL